MEHLFNNANNQQLTNNNYNVPNIMLIHQLLENICKDTNTIINVNQQDRIITMQNMYSNQFIMTDIDKINPDNWPGRYKLIIFFLNGFIRYNFNNDFINRDNSILIQGLNTKIYTDASIYKYDNRYEYKSQIWFSSNFVNVINDLKYSDVYDTEEWPAQNPTSINFHTIIFFSQIANNLLINKPATDDDYKFIIILIETIKKFNIVNNYQNIKNIDLNFNNEDYSYIVTENYIIKNKKPSKYLLPKYIEITNMVNELMD